MTRSELVAANEQLLARRKREQVGPKPIERIAQAADREAIEAYLTSPVGFRLPVHRAGWDSFDSDRHPTLQRAVRAIKQWYSDRLDSGGSIILAGDCGCGKTHLARAVHELYGFGATYLNEIEMVKKVQASYSGGGRSLESIVADVRRAKLLVYDDLGAYETDNLPWMQNIYMSLFDQRYEESRPMLITTNLKMIEAGLSDGEPTWSPLEERIGKRVYSRVIGAVGEVGYFVNLFGVPDYRLRGF